MNIILGWTPTMSDIGTIVSTTWNWVQQQKLGWKVI